MNLDPILRPTFNISDISDVWPSIICFYYFAKKCLLEANMFFFAFTVRPLSCNCISLRASSTVSPDKTLFTSSNQIFKYSNIMKYIKYNQILRSIVISVQWLISCSHQLLLLEEENGQFVWSAEDISLKMVIWWSVDFVGIIMRIFLSFLLYLWLGRWSTHRN